MKGYKYRLIIKKWTGPNLPIIKGNLWRLKNLTLNKREKSINNLSIKIREINKSTSLIKRDLNNLSLITLEESNKIRLLHDSGYTWILDDLNYPTEYFEEKNISKLIENQGIIVQKLKEIKETLENINVKEGYISSTDIFDKKHYPIIAEIAKKLLSDGIIKENISTIDLCKYYKWISHILLLNYYSLTNKCLNSINNNIDKSLRNQDLLLELKGELEVLRNWSVRFLDPSIRQHLKRSKIKIIPEIYTGFDTEYIPEDWGKNKLLSAQLAITGGLKLEVPLARDYSYEGVNTLTSETYLKSEDSIPESLNKDFILKYIQTSINYNRLLLYKDNDQNLEDFCSYLLNNQKGKIDQYNKTEKGLIFQFKKLPIIQKLILGKDSEELEISWNTLVKTINESVYKELEIYINKIIEPFKLQGEINKDLLSDLEPKETGSWKGETIPKKETETIILSNSDNLKLSKSDTFKMLKSKTIKTNKFELKMSINWRMYLLCHYNAADLSLIKDWDTIKKKNVDIIKGSFLSICKPIHSLGCRIYLRDTICLSSAAAKTLAAIGKAHNIPKIEIEKSYLENMGKLLTEKPDLFRDYAMTDSIITLIHGLFMNDFTFRLGSLTLPCTLGSISSIYVKKEWISDKYQGYQIHPDYPLGNIQKSINPTGLHALGTTANYLPMFIGNTLALDSYRGGRNEAFMYGMDKDNIYKDYDFSACYSTVMSMCGDPDYTRSFYLTNKNIKKLDPKFLRESYTSLDISFKLPSSIKYPSLPVSVGKNLTIYSLEGRTIVTGLEYSTALNILNSALNKIKDPLEQSKYFIKIHTGICIPFKRSADGSLSYPPFKSVIKKLQASRRLHPKKSAMERIYKDLGNMLYGKVVCGISNKRNFDARVEAMKSMTGSELSNPIIGSWITGFVRSLMAELLNQVDLLGGLVPSATTDGFVSNIKDLENKLVEISLNNESEKVVKKLTLSRLKIERTLNIGEILISEIEKILNYENIKISVDILNNPTKYISGNIEKLEGPILGSLKSSFIMPPLEEHRPMSNKTYHQTTKIEGPLIPRFITNTNPNSFKTELQGIYQKTLKIYKEILEIINLDIKIFTDENPLIISKEKCGWYVNNTELYNKYMLNIYPTIMNFNPKERVAFIKLHKFFREIKCWIRFERIIWGTIMILESYFNAFRIKDLEREISGINILPLLNMYRNIRLELSGNPESLEVKTTVKGIIQWTTRGQVSILNEETDPVIAALTGFQKREVSSHNELVNLVENTMKNGNKLKFLQKSLTGALDNYKYNKHVSMICSLRNFKTIFDCKRELIISENNTGMLESKPYKNKEQCILNRTLMNNYKTALYNRYMDNKLIKTSKNIVQESMKYLIRSFVNFYKNNTPLSEKLKLISIFKGYNKEKLFQIIADSEINKGMAVNKLIKYSKNIEFFNSLKDKFIGSPYYERFLVDFSNFNK